MTLELDLRSVAKVVEARAVPGDVGGHQSSYPQPSKPAGIALLAALAPEKPCDPPQDTYGMRADIKVSWQGTDRAWHG